MPIMRKKRLGKLLTSDDPIVKALVGTTHYRKILDSVAVPTRLDHTNITSGAVLQVAWREKLISSVDGAGLASHSKVPKYIGGSKVARAD